jgi:hypothetical protein
MKYNFHRVLAGGESLKSGSTDFSRKNKLNILRFEEIFQVEKEKEFTG